MFTISQRDREKSAKEWFIWKSAIMALDIRTFFLLAWIKKKSSVNVYDTPMLTRLTNKPQDDFTYKWFQYLLTLQFNDIKCLLKLYQKQKKNFELIWRFVICLGIFLFHKLYFLIKLQSIFRAMFITCLDVHFSDSVVVHNFSNTENHMVKIERERDWNVRLGSKFLIDTVEIREILALFGLFRSFFLFFFCKK